MSTGTVKWFNSSIGYGFITPDAGGQDVFVHISAVEKAGMRFLNEHDKVSYDLVTEKGKTSAGNLKKAQFLRNAETPEIDSPGFFCGSLSYGEGVNFLFHTNRLLKNN